jgi:hypothetical protein
VCVAKAREAIEARLIAGESGHAVGTRFGLPPSWVASHAREHLSVEQRERMAAREAEQGTPHWKGGPVLPSDIEGFRGAYPGG